MSIAKNTAFMTIASIGQKIISFVYFTIVARSIGAEGTGKYFFALSFTTIFVVFVDLGFTSVLVREAAKIKEHTQKYFSSVLSIKILFGVLSYIAAIIVINLMGYSVETKQLVYLSAVTMLFDSLHLTIYGVLRAIGTLKYEAIGIIGSQFVTLILGSIFLFLKLPLIFLILAFTIPSVLNATFAAMMLATRYQIRIVPHFDKEILAHLGKIAIPFALTAIFARVYGYIDSILLSKLAGDTAVGWYSIPYKITFAFQFIPLALVAALYPRFSEYFAHSKEKLAFIFEQGIKYLLIIAFPIAIGIALLAKDIVITLYTTEYANSILPLQILIISLLFSFVSFPIGSFLNACNKQAIQTVIVGTVMVINIILNLALIPRYGVVGAASAAFVGNFLLTVIGYSFVPRITRISHMFLLKTIFQVILATVVMGVFVWYTSTVAHFTVAIAIGAVVYGAMLFATRTVTARQLREAMTLIRK